MNGWVKYREAGDLRRHRTHSNVTVMCDGRNRILFHIYLIFYLIQKLQQLHDTFFTIPLSLSPGDQIFGEMLPLDILINSLRPSDAYMRQ